MLLIDAKVLVDTRPRNSVHYNYFKNAKTTEISTSEKEKRKKCLFYLTATKLQLLSAKIRNEIQPKYGVIYSQNTDLLALSNI